MLEVLKRWNRWGNGKLRGGIEREITKKLPVFFHTPEVIALIGPRRAGKTTILFQIMDSLEKEGIPQEAMLHINFEEPALSPELGVDLLDKLYRVFREEIYPSGRAYLFLDEIQNVPQWEKWARARNESEDIKLFISGSSSKLMSKELGTVLTGRHIAFQIFPLNFREFLHFKAIEPPKRLIQTNTATPILQHALNEYLQWGGFPEVVLAESEQRKALLLKQYFDDILFKDVAMRHHVRDTFALRNLAVYLLTHSSSLVSFQRLAKVFEVSLDLVRSYCQYLQEAFIIDLIPFYSRKAAERQRNPHKVYALDLGLRNIVSLSSSIDRGHVIETAVYHKLQQQINDGIFYWKRTNEIDFVVRKGTNIKNIIQVTTNLANIDTQQRELKACEEAFQFFPQASSIIIAENMPKQLIKAKNLQIKPFWFVLIDCGAVI